MNTKQFRSLNRKLITSVLVAAVGFAVTVAVGFYFIELDRSRDKMRVMTNQLLDTVEYSTAIAAYTNNKQIADEVIQGLLRNDIVNAVTIKGNDGLFLEKNKKVFSDTDQRVTRKLLAPFDNVQEIGSISVVPPADYNSTEAIHSALLSAINSFLLITLATAIIWSVFKRVILQPLTYVSDTLHQISAGEKQRIAPSLKNQNDELGRLVFDINGLLNTLEIKFDNERSLREKIEQIENQLRDIFDSTSAGLFLLNNEGKLLTSNPTFTKILKVRVDRELTGCDIAEEFFENPEQMANMLVSAVNSNTLIANDIALRANAEHSEQRWVHCLLSRIEDRKGQQLFEGVIFDISSRIAKENAMRYHAEFDALTGILRRESAERKLAEFLATQVLTPLVVMLLDLDGFKAINDNYGHSAGDEVLVEVTKRFKNTIRSSDVVARIGGDEFLIILTKCDSIGSEIGIANKIIHALQETIVLQSQQEVNVGVSIGIASNLTVNPNVASMLKAADEAMYAVKRQGKNGFGFYQGENDINVEVNELKNVRC